MRLLPFLALKSLFPLVPFCVFVFKGMKFDIPWLSAKYSDLVSIFPSCPGSALATLLVVLLESFSYRTIFLPIDVLMTTLLVVSVVEFLWRWMLFWLPEFLNCTLLELLYPILELESLPLCLKLKFWPSQWSYFAGTLSKRACWHAAERRWRAIL